MHTRNQHDESDTSADGASGGSDKQVADLIVERLRAWGTERIYGYAGDGNNPLLGALRRAFRSALAKGHPAVIILPHGVQSEPAPDLGQAHGEVVTAPRWTSGQLVPREEDLSAAVEILESGERIAILAGRGVRGAEDAVLRLADRLGAGVATSLLGKPYVDESHPLAAGTMGHLGTTASAGVLQGCDTLLIIGSNDPWTEFYPPPGQARAVQIDTDPAVIANRYPVEVGLAGDSGTAIDALMSRLRPRGRTPWREEVERLVRSWRDVARERAEIDAMRTGLEAEGDAGAHGLRLLDLYAQIEDAHGCGGSPSRVARRSSPASDRGERRLAQQAREMRRVRCGCLHGRVDRIRNLREVLEIVAAHRLAVPIHAALRGDREPHVGQRLREDADDVMRAVLVADHDRNSDPIEQRRPPGVVDLRQFGVKPFEHTLRDARRLAQPCRRREHENVGGQDALEERGPFVARTHVALHAGLQVMIDHAHGVPGDAVRRQLCDDETRELVRARLGRRRLQRAVEDESSQFISHDRTLGRAAAAANPVVLCEPMRWESAASAPRGNADPRRGARTLRCGARRHRPIQRVHKGIKALALSRCRRAR